MAKQHTKDYAVLLEKVKERPDHELIQTMLLRSLSQAVYHADNIGHFGLALEEYAHFTSPIRRYPDLTLHRGIKYLLAKEQGAKLKQRILAVIITLLMNGFTRQSLFNDGTPC